MRVGKVGKAGGKNKSEIADVDNTVVRTVSSCARSLLNAIVYFGITLPRALAPAAPQRTFCT